MEFNILKLNSRMEEKKRKTVEKQTDCFNENVNIVKTDV